MGLFKDFHRLKNKISLLTSRRKHRQIILTGIILILTVSIILAVPETNKTITNNALPSNTKTAIKASGALLWNKSYGGTGVDVGYCVEQTTDGGYIIAGFTNSTGVGIDDVWLIKTDENGDHVWNQTYGGTDSERGFCVEQTTDGGYIIVGYTWSFGAGADDVWLIKTDTNGNEEWNETYGGTARDRCWCVEQTTDSGYIMVGETNSSGAGFYDVWLIKTDENGNEEWNETYGGAENDYGYYVEQATDGGYIIAGYTNSSGASSFDIWLIKTNSTGGHEWSKNFGGAGYDVKWLNKHVCVRKTSDGGYIITGSTTSSGNYDFWLVKTDENGDEEWNQTYGETIEDWGYYVDQTRDGGYIITGYKWKWDLGPQEFPDIWLIRTDENGNEVWNQTYGGSDCDQGFCVKQTSDGGYIITGWTRTFSATVGISDVWLLKILADNPVANAGPDQSVYVGDEVTFVGSDSYDLDGYIVSYSWEFDDGDTGTGISPSHNYTSEGTYTITLTVTDNDGLTDTDTMTVTVSLTTPELPKNGTIMLLFIITISSLLTTLLKTKNFSTFQRKNQKRKT